MNYALPDPLPDLDVPDLVHVPCGLAEPSPPVFLSAPSQEELFARLRLIRSRRVGPATWRRLLAVHGSAVAALEALPDVAAQAGDSRYRAADPAHIRREIHAARGAGARMLTLGAPGYPERLAQTADAPPVLWAQGDADLMTGRCVALIGTRNASSLGLRMARALGRALAEEGITVISGLARGIDAVAHDAALAGGTVAVHAGGLDCVYPSENLELAARIAAEGCSVSERPFGLSPQARDFPRRNRIVAGLSQAVVVVEAAAKSGSMITARDALDAGRDVLAVPGHPFDGRTGGCNLLLRDGATLVRGVEDILQVLDDQPEATATTQPHETDQTPPSPAADIDGDAVQQKILTLLSTTPVSEDDLTRDLTAQGQIPGPALAMQLSELELSGIIARQPGGGLIRL